MELINNILWWCLWSVLLLQAYVLLFNKGIPNFKTAPPIRRAIIDILKKHVNDKKSQRFTIVDLGCGNGKFTREIAKALPDTTVMGVEIAKIPYIQACFWRKMKNLKNLYYVNADFNDFDTGDVDVVVMYLDAPFMKDMEDKLKRELKSGALVISNSYRFRKNWDPVETHDVKTYRHAQGRFYVYRK